MRVDYHPLSDDLSTDVPPSYGAMQSDQGHPGKSGSNDTKIPIQGMIPSSGKTSAYMGIGVDGNSPCIPFRNLASSKRTSLEIRNTVLRLLRHLLQVDVSLSSVAVSLLDDCAGTCVRHGVSFSDILQSQSIEGHTALYWAIVKSSPGQLREVEMNQVPDLLAALYPYARPLKEQTITEMRQACLATSNQNLFKKIRQWPGVARMPAEDRMLLGMDIPLDEIEVEELESSFAVNFVVPQFHKRMAISKSIQLEFIAGGRLWRMSFFVASEAQGAPAGSWCISLSLQESSPPTHIDSRVLFFQAPSSSDSQPDTSAFSFDPSQSNFIDVCVKSDKTQLAANKVWLFKSLQNVGAILQFPNNSYIGSDEKLRGRFEAKLTV